VNRARKGNRRTFKAHGRIKDYCSSPAHIELFVVEQEKDVPKPSAENKQVKLTKKQAAVKRLKIGQLKKEE
jgi:large subunit ribosomal protein L17e